MSAPEFVPGVPGPREAPRERADERGTRLDRWWAGMMTDPLMRRVWTWGAPALVVVVAAILRLQNLGQPYELVFDETYYVKDAWTLSHLGYEAAWGPNADALFAKGDPNHYSTSASFIAHPPLGKWMIALGMLATGGGNPAGWRISTALVGILLVVVTMLIARRILHSTLLAVIAGGLLAIDGNAIVMSRVALLDNSVALFALLGAGAMLLDRDATRRRLDAWVVDRELAHRPIDRGPMFLWRPWLIAAGVAFGAASSVKWSGLYFLLVFGLYAVLSDLLARRSAGCASWLSGTLLRQAPWNLVLLVPVALTVYVASWTGWFVTRHGYYRTWVEDGNPRWTGLLHGVPLTIQNWWHYQVEIYGFNVGEHTPHSYQANPLTWLFMVRPTAMVYHEYPNGTGLEVTGIANPLIWYACTAALVFAIVRLVRTRDRQLGFIVTGVVAGYAPWLLYLNRTVFQFYTIAFEPFLVLGLAAALGFLLGRPTDARARRRRNLVAVGAFLGACVLFSAFWYPIWSGQVVPLWFIRAHWWLPGWV